MTKLLPAAAVLALTLAACNGNSTASNTVAPIDPMAENVARPANPVTLPPAVKSSKAYRCDDNSIVTVDLFQGDKQANIRADKTSANTALTAETAGGPLVAEGYEVTGTGDSLTITRPGHPKQKCAA